jgi:hypothetical protein
MYDRNDIRFGEWRLQLAVAGRGDGGGNVLSWGVVVQHPDGPAIAGWVMSLDDQEIEGVYETFPGRDAYQNLQAAMARLMSEPL